MHILPYVKKLEIKDGFLPFKTIKPYTKTIDSRILKAINKLPVSCTGAELIINAGVSTEQNYSITINEDSVNITAPGIIGVFYAIQTLRQIFAHEKIPCLYIEDAPDFEYRGFYHDVSRGKIPTVETLKKLIDNLAYYKVNSLQLYNEHIFECEETKDVTAKTGCLTEAEIREIQEYCEENFIDFIPSMSTFGHLFEILEQEKYKHLRVLKDYEANENFWLARVFHHTIDPLNPESIELIKKLIDNYSPIFNSEWFNLCGDETFDLKYYDSEKDPAKLYLDFMLKVIDHVTSKGKRPMMWADILLKHPEIISELPDDICLLNWCYVLNPCEDNFKKIAELGKKQIVCPGIGTWNRLCERVDKEINIAKMAEYGYKYGAVGMLNTCWGDWGNPASIELSMYGLVTGAVKSWNVNTEYNEDYYSAVNEIVYGSASAMDYVRRISILHDPVMWDRFCHMYFIHRYGTDTHFDSNIVNLSFELTSEQISFVQKEYREITDSLSKERWTNDEIREELLICTEGICVVAELYAKLANIEVERTTDTMSWLKKYKSKWLAKNKPSELYQIEKLFTYLEEM